MTDIYVCPASILIILRGWRDFFRENYPNASADLAVMGYSICSHLHVNITLTSFHPLQGSSATQGRMLRMSILYELKVCK